MTPICVFSLYNIGFNHVGNLNKKKKKKRRRRRKRKTKKERERERGRENEKKKKISIYVFSETDLVELVAMTEFIEEKSIDTRVETPRIVTHRKSLKTLKGLSRIILQNLLIARFSSKLKE